MNRLVKGDIAYLLKPISLIFVIIAMFIALFNIGTKEITKLRANLEELKSEQLKLTAKLNVLSSVPSGSTEDNSIYTVAIPNQSSSLFAFSQLKRSALENNLILSSMRSATPVENSDGVFATSISFDIDGKYEDVFLFLSNISKMLPLMNLNKLDITQNLETISATVNLDVYSAPYPKVIPSISTAVTALTPSENELINELSSFSSPEFTSLSPILNETREDPFN